MSESVRQALALTRDSSARDRTADITTIGRRTGRSRRIEIWFYRVDDINYLSGLPGARGWYANLLAEPGFVFHLSKGIRADLPARGRPVTDQEERRRILSSIVDDLNQPSNPARITQPTHLAEWLKGAPLIEISFSEV